MNEQENNQIKQEEQTTKQEQETKPETQNKPLNFFEKIRIKKLKKQITKLIKEDKQEEQQQRKKLITILEQAQKEGIEIIETECYCKQENCEKTGRNHEKTERQTTKKELEQKPLEELITLVTNIFDYEKWTKQ